MLSTLYFTISGMTCSGCSMAVENILKASNLFKRGDIKQVEVNISTHEARVVVNPKIALDSLSAVVDEIIKEINTLKFVATWKPTLVYPSISLSLVPEENTETKTLYVKIEPLSEDMQNLDDEQIHNIQNYILSFTFVGEVKLDIQKKRAVIKIKENTPLNKLKPIFEQAGFNASFLADDQEKTFYFSVKGLKTALDAKTIEEELRRDRMLVKACLVNYSTRTITITAAVDDDPIENKILQKNWCKRIKYALRNTEANVKAQLIESSLDAHRETNHSRSYLGKALINLLVSIPYVLLSSRIPAPLTWNGQLIGLMISSVTLGVMWLTGREFYQDAWRIFIKNRSSNMNTLILLGTTSAWLYSTLLVLMPTFFPLAALQYQFLAITMILGIVNLGNGAKVRAQERAKKEIQNLERIYVESQPQLAKRVKLAPGENFDPEGRHEIEEINYTDIQQNDIIQVKKDERFPVDGTIINDVETYVRQDIVTGEAKGCAKKRGSMVYSGCLNEKNVVVYLRASSSGKEGCLNKLIEGVKKASYSKSSVSKLADTLAVFFTPAIVSLAGASALGWLLIGPAPQLPLAIKSFMSVLLCACPCAWGLATPISTTLSMYRLFNKEILVHDANALEAMAYVDTIVFDKTGTLTIPVIHKIYTGNQGKEWNREDILKYVASLEQKFVKEQKFNHPIADCFIAECSSVELLPCSEVGSAGSGVYGTVDGKKMLVGNSSCLSVENIFIPEEYLKEEDRHAKAGMSSIYVVIDKCCVAIAALKHEIREDARSAIHDLKSLGISIFMLTGDEPGAAKAVARSLKITNVEAGKTMDEKRAWIKQIKSNGRRVAMVGDGLNDAGALQEADVGIAMGPWTFASTVSGIALRKLDLAILIAVARATMRNIYQNLLWTGFYNFLSLMMATGLLYPLTGFVLNPVIASFSMAFSSIFVILNSSGLNGDIDRAIERVIGRCRRSATQPTTWWQKCQDLFSLTKLYQTLDIFIGFSSQPSFLSSKVVLREPLNRAIIPGFTNMLNRSPRLLLNQKKVTFSPSPSPLKKGGLTAN